MNESDYPDMSPEVFVRLRLMGLTVGGMWAIARVYPRFSFGRLAEAWEEEDESLTRRDVDYWNECAKDRFHG